MNQLPFLITGLPRSRTAWLSAVLTAHGAPCTHDGIVNDIPEGWGLSDPAAACVFPHRALELVGDNPIVVIFRDENVAMASFAYEFGELTDEARESMLRAWRLFMDFVEYDKRTLFVNFCDLKDNQVVSTVIEYCTGSPSSHDIIEAFQLLKITQRPGPAQERLDARTEPSTLIS